MACSINASPGNLLELSDSSGGCVDYNENLAHLLRRDATVPSELAKQNTNPLLVFHRIGEWPVGLIRWFAGTRHGAMTLGFTAAIILILVVHRPQVVGTVQNVTASPYALSNHVE